MDSEIREKFEKREHLFLCERAAFSDKAKRERPEEPCTVRTAYQRDRDRIIHSSAFRRLKHKTQVFLSPEGDHYRTRLTHTLEVSQISRSVARALDLNEDLTEAISLGHDLGHTPFGHAGERALDKICPDGFKHYEQSVRVCRVLEKQGKGLNLTTDTLNGILCHTKGQEASTLEGRIVRHCDQIAYINHDIDDAVRGGIINEEDIPYDIRQHFGFTKSERINSMVLSIVSNSGDTITLKEADKEMFNKLHSFLFEAVYFNPKAKAEEQKVYGILKGIYDKLIEKPDKLPESYHHIIITDGIERAVIDYIAGMTDTYAVKFYENEFIPKSWSL